MKVYQTWSILGPEEAYLSWCRGAHRKNTAPNLVSMQESHSPSYLVISAERSLAFDLVGLYVHKRADSSYGRHCAIFLLRQTPLKYFSKGISFDVVGAVQNAVLELQEVLLSTRWEILYYCRRIDCAGDFCEIEAGKDTARRDSQKTYNLDSGTEIRTEQN